MTNSNGSSAGYVAVVQHVDRVVELGAEVSRARVVAGTDKKGRPSRTHAHT